jgi:TDG/mug DNA glycosylase family protein
LSPAEAPPLLAGLPPLLGDRSRVLVLGSFPSLLSLQKREYYGNPMNAFWRIMEALFEIDHELPYERRTNELLDHGVAVWDVIATCHREGSGDQAIEKETANPLMGLLAEHPDIRHIAFNGSMAWDTARRSVPQLFSGDLHCERMPSTSPKHATRSLPDKIEAWSNLQEWLQDVRE